MSTRLATLVSTHYHAQCQCPISFVRLTILVILITGGNIGLGRESVHQLAKYNPARIYLTARSREKAEATIKEVNATLPESAQSTIKFLECDLTSFESIKQAAKTFTSENERLDILMNNAGIMATPAGTTKEGYEIQFGTNHVGHALLTKLLLPTLTKTAKSGPNGTADVRIVNLSSAAERFAPKPEGIKFDKLKTADGGLGTWGRYGQSKLANIYFARALAQKHPELTVVSVHPGAINTNLMSGPIASYGWFLAYPAKVIGMLFMKTVREGAFGQTWAAVAPIAKKDGDEGVKSGTFYWPVGRTDQGSALANDERLTKELWDWTEKELDGQSI